MAAFTTINHLSLFAIWCGLSTLLYAYFGGHGKIVEMLIATNEKGDAMNGVCVYLYPSYNYK